MAAPDRDGFIHVDGWREFQRDLRRAKSTRYPAEIRTANRETGKFIKRLVDRESSPAAVGRGRGSTLRPSSSRREVLLRVGGGHRAGKTPYMQWGFRPARTPGMRAPKRPYIRQIADEHREEIGVFFLKAIADAMDTAFYTTEP